ncbi:class E sortase [Kribbella qitaiheensis]|uniref:Class E sortase n=1 Tax=Kribbella qitaiheensis TaxID=1544730 RepID=A0A7G6WW95_9ACTN|nr:class E sortase [Kribbella qitaiheensis]QNE18260.1 class E sortase [Kribbella qitaiheensis]
MRGWKPVWRWVAASSGFAALVVVGVVVFGPDSSTSASQSAGPPTGQTQPGSAASSADPALVDRMLDQLRDGKPVEPQFSSGDNPAQGVPIEAIKAKPGEQLRLGRLVIPKLGVDQQLNNGVDEAALVHGVGHWPGTPLPGSPGNSVVSGHRSTNEKPFLHLERLKSGDPIRVTVGDRTMTYKVIANTIVPESGYVQFVLRQPTKPADKLITLFACNPLTAHYQRIVVQARAVEGGPTNR